MEGRTRTADGRRVPPVLRYGIFVIHIGTKQAHEIVMVRQHALYAGGSSKRVGLNYAPQISKTLQLSGTNSSRLGVLFWVGVRVWGSFDLL